MEYDILPGRGSENAKKAIALAKKRGFASADVRTFRGGYYVPVTADEIVSDDPNGEPVEIVGTPGEAEETETKPAKKPARKRNNKKE